MAAPELRFRTVIVPFGPAAAIMLTEEQASQLSSAKTPAVIVTVGERSARLRVTRMGGPVCIGLSKASRAALGVELGDEVEVTVALDTAERTVDIPPLLAEALEADPAVKAAFDALSYTRRKEIAVSIAEAKQEATRLRRLEKALSELRG
ncbi:MAG: YdeI/OmpD-associated family protein [Propionibacteriaceae bacterium]|nr:YdeI/OmpD-associated family protein [Propionibacteriaceae bacterium]